MNSPSSIPSQKSRFKLHLCLQKKTSSAFLSTKYGGQVSVPTLGSIIPFIESTANGKYNELASVDLKLFASTFLLIFLAELGDKTQLAVVALSAKEKSPLTLFVSAMFGFALATVIAIAIGTVGARFISTNVIEKIAAVAFIVIGVLIFANKI